MRFALLLMPCLAFSVDNMGGSLTLSSGYRFDNWKMEGLSSNTQVIEKVQQMEGISVGASGRIRFDNYYLRARGQTFFVLSSPKYYTMIGGTPNLTQTLERKHGYNVDGAAGYTFFFGCDLFSLAPEVGYSYQTLDITTDISASAGMPFVGLSFGAKVSPGWYFALSSKYLFLGFNHINIHPSSTTGLSEVKEGTYSGPEIDLALDYVLTENWTLGLGYQFRYIYTDHKNYSSTFTDAHMRWITNTASLNLSYVF